MIIIGMLANGIQMLSFPPRWLGFSRYAMVDTSTGANIDLTPKEERKTELHVLSETDLSKVQFRRRSLWLSPDGFAAALASHLSNNALAGETKLSQVHPELLDESYWARFSPIGQATTVARKADAIQIEACWTMPAKSLLIVTRNTDRGTASIGPAKDDDEKIPSGYRLVAVRAKLTADATDDSSQYRFTTNQVRLATKNKRGVTASYGLVGINAAPEELSAATGKDIHYRLNDGEAINRAIGRFNFVFQIPDDTDPWYIVFRRNARAEIRGVQKDAPKSPVFTPKAAPKKAGNGNGGAGGATDPSDTKDGDGSGTGGRGGRISRVHSKLEGHFFGDELPFELSRYADDGLETRGDAVTTGRLTAVLDKDDMPLKGKNSSKSLKRIQLSSDSVRLLQLNMERVFPGSLHGQVMDFAKQNNPVRVKDSHGKSYTAVGMYVFGTLGGKRTFELVYFDDTSRQSAGAIAKPTHILGQHMKAGDKMYYLFEVPEGTEIVSFINPSNAEENLRSAKLVAPK